MAKKRKHFNKRQKSHSRRRTDSDRGKKRSHEPGNSILAFLFRQSNPQTIQQILEGSAESLSTRKELEEQLARLVRRGDIVSAGKKRFMINPKGSLFGGRLEKHPRGFGFITQLVPAEAAQSLTRDPFISVSSMGSANHGDRLLIRVLRVRKDGRPEAEIVTILERNAETITGFYRNGPPAMIIPEDPRYPSSIRLLEGAAEALEENTVVVVSIVPQQGGGHQLCGKIIEVLGSAEDIDVQMRIVIEKHNLPHIFPAKVMKEAEKLSFSETDLKGRLDLRHTLHVTIDGETAKDFDDAIAVEKTRKGYRLYVSIADVSHYVQPGTALDHEAYLRGTSIYFPGRVIPMLPEKLSNNLCSLVPDKDRLTFTAVLDFTTSGRLLSKKFSKSVINSKKRFTYTTVSKILIDKDSEAMADHEEFLTPLKWAKELAEALLARRIERGSIGFNLPEPEVMLDGEGKIATITRKERNFAHQIIEEFMLAANEAVAHQFTEIQQDFIYRIHEKPSPQKVEEFVTFAKSLSFEIPPPGPDPDPSWFGKILSVVKNSPAEYVVNNLLLRTMQQARYDSTNVGHFGLAATDYTHFTSPIRRYPDLMVHRFLDSFIQKAAPPAAGGELPLTVQADHLSSRERTAITAERDITDRLKVFFMEQFTGSSFHAVISGVTDSAIFVELTELFISGSIDPAELRDDYYLYDGRHHRLIGEISGKMYQLGDEIEVVLLGVDHRLQRIHFTPAEK